MNELTERTYRFSVAALAAGFTSKQLRYLMHEVGAQFDHDSDRIGPQWRQFSLLDVVRLTLIKCLMGYGCEATVAEQIARYVVVDRTSLLQAYRKTPAKVLAAALRHNLLIVKRNTDGWHPSMVKAMPTIEIPEHAIVVRLAGIIDSVLDRLNETADEP